MKKKKKRVVWKPNKVSYKIDIDDNGIGTMTVYVKLVPKKDEYLRYFRLAFIREG